MKKTYLTVLYCIAFFAAPPLLASAGGFDPNNPGHLNDHEYRYALDIDGIKREIAQTPAAAEPAPAAGLATTFASPAASLVRSSGDALRNLGVVTIGNGVRWFGALFDPKPRTIRIGRTMRDRYNSVTNNNEPFHEYLVKISTACFIASPFIYQTAKNDFHEICDTFIYGAHALCDGLRFYAQVRGLIRFLSRTDTPVRIKFITDNEPRTKRRFLLSDEFAVCRPENTNIILEYLRTHFGQRYVSYDALLDFLIGQEVIYERGRIDATGAAADLQPEPDEG